MDWAISGWRGLDYRLYCNQVNLQYCIAMETKRSGTLEAAVKPVSPPTQETPPKTDCNLHHPLLCLLLVTHFWSCFLLLLFITLMPLPACSSKSLLHLANQSISDSQDASTNQLPCRNSINKMQCWLFVKSGIMLRQNQFIRLGWAGPPCIILSCWW